MKENKQKCFAEHEQYCSILTKKEDCGNCKFFKTTKQYVCDRLKYMEKEQEFLQYSDQTRHKFETALKRKLNNL